MFPIQWEQAGHRNRVLRRAGQPESVFSARRGRCLLDIFTSSSAHFMLTTRYVCLYGFNRVILLGTRFQFLFNLPKPQGHYQHSR